jgi:cold shock CspA family protein
LRHNARRPLLTINNGWTMYQGTIQNVVVDRGFGFISSTGQPDVFFHCSDLAADLPFDETLRERRVRFDIVTTPKGLRATSIVSAA